MGLSEVIDLSSDDEVPPPTLSTTTASTVKTKSKPAFQSATQGHDGFARLNEQREEVAPKRRRLSPSSIFDDGIISPQSLHKDPQLPSKRLPSHRGPQKEIWASPDGSDPIVYTSSLGRKTSQVNSRIVNSDVSDDSLPEDLFTVPSRARPSTLSARTSALLDHLSQPPPTKPSYARKLSSDKVTKLVKRSLRDPVEDGESTGPEEDPAAVTRQAKGSRKTKLTEEEKAAQMQENEREKALKAKEKEIAKRASKEQKAKEKEEDQERKRIGKEEKAREKRIAVDLAEVNKAKLDKKDSTPEMIVDLPASIDGQRVDTQVREFLRSLGVDTTPYQSQVPNVIKWRRKMKARWNAEAGRWEPIERMEILEEKHILCIMSAKEFIALAMAREDDQDVETHVARLKSAYESCTPIYLIEGLHASMKRNKTAENRAYQAKVNSIGQSDGNATPSQTAARNKRPPAELIDEDLIEDALLRLQVMSGCLVHHTAASVETAEWIANFTQHISTIPYRYTA